jgi:eukaryotic-like serine/threonine-protein kinase
MPGALWYCPSCQAEGNEDGITFCQNDGTRVRPIGERGAEWIGKTLADRYRVLRFVAAGGTAEVYEAERIGSGKRVALKLLHATMAANLSAMFLREAQMVSLIAHPNVVAIDDFGTLANGINYMVMELLSGRALDVLLDAGPMPVPLALKYAMQACEGLAAAHARDVLHCDIKPPNFFLHAVDGEQPVVKILDLGIGRMLAQSAHTPSGTVAGTPAYMSPEQAQGHELADLSDIYSMGVTVWEMLLGEVPFQHESYVEVLQMQINAEPIWPAELAAQRGIPPEAEAVLLKALAKDPAARHESMLDLQRDLASIARSVRGRALTQMPPPVSRGPVSSGATTQRAPTRAPLFPPSKPGVFSPVRHTPMPIVRPPPVAAPVKVNVARLADASGGDDQAVEIAPDVYWVGRRHGQLLECNAYLLVLRRGTKQVAILVDPGPPEDLEVVARKVEAVMGSRDRIDFVFLNHHDPDVAANAAAVQQWSRSTQVICSEDTFRHARFYGLDPKRFMAVESFAGGICTLPTGHTIVFLPAPFCHNRGAVMLFDPISRVLFSGDLFGGARAPVLVASELSWPGVEMFHQIYMPSQRALGLAAGRVQRLSPSPQLIAPHHGALIVGNDVARFVERVGRLEVGLDLPDAPANLDRYLAVANAIATAYEEIAGVDGSRALKAGFAGDGSFSRLFSLDGRRAIASFKVAPRLALEAFVDDAIAAVPEAHRTSLRRTIEGIYRRHELTLRDGVRPNE